jgi:hypothetical protein
MVPIRLRNKPVNSVAMSETMAKIAVPASVASGETRLLSVGIDWIVWEVLVTESTILESAPWIAVMAVVFSFRMLVCAALSSES